MSRDVAHRLLVLLALGCSFLIVASFGMFARDQIAGASQHQQVLLAAGAHEDPGVDPVASHHGQPRTFIDAAATRLTGPFRQLAPRDSVWAEHVVPMLLGLLLYGVGLGYLARFSSGLAHGRQHAEPAASQ